ncbi:PTS sugar transporter subunit IIA [Pseudoruegeria sp. SK021]|uniref:PTS sugar transporter subunit IIA n=1 Tax=Pseudoruegeria sp. SK021 TaxID=1933035 RepID=UPI000A239741|nr:PTS fructose transporter subunit IIA [Pseudoruegeria sp. SK021]OSP55106.1 PTS fructose transporter subunit IIA [Pseudoruegeria sp. SK021]
MIGIVLVAHGGLAREFLATVEHVLGKQAAIRAISIGVQEDRVAKAREILEATAQVDCGAGVVVVVDMFGGSPSNLSLPACDRPDRLIVYGANLPMLVKMVRVRHLPLRDAVTRAVQDGRKYLDCFDAFGN